MFGGWICRCASQWQSVLTSRLEGRIGPVPGRTGLGRTGLVSALLLSTSAVSAQAAPVQSTSVQAVPAQAAPVQAAPQVTPVQTASPQAALFSQVTLAQVPVSGSLSTTRALLSQLDEAICLSQWDRAIDLTGVILALPEISPTYRQQMIDFRAGLMELRSFEAVLPNNSSCDRANALTLSAPVPAQNNADAGINWPAGIAAISGGNRQIVQLDSTPNDLVNPPIPLALLEGSPIAFSNAIPLDTRDGFSVVAGAVAPNRQQTYAFVARIGDRITLDLDVTRIAIDAGITGEDSHLFLFDHAGRIIGENDDADGRQSRISQAVVLDTQVYYVAVTSHNNLPILNDNGQLIGWTGTGITQFDYTLTLTGTTPSGDILRY